MTRSGVTKIRDFLGPYRLSRLIRAGQTSQVWEAHNDKTSERFALKVLKPDLRKDRRELGYLKHEFEVAKDLNHPNIIKLHEFCTQYQTPFLVLELYSALNLKQVLREGPEHIAHLTEKIVHQSSHALQYFHTKGWIHCDLKPDNLLVNEEGNVKLIDFTISQKPKPNLLRFLGIKSTIRGTRSYMSPEQIRGKTLDGRSDVYSFGCVVFELLTGKPPYTGSTPNELLSRHLNASIPSPVMHNSNVTRDFSDLLRRMMAKVPAARPASMWEVLQECKKIRIFNKRPTPPAKALSEIETKTITDIDDLKNVSKKKTQKPEEE